jgi:hypothetical protein
MSTVEKKKVLTKIAKGQVISPLGNAKVIIGKRVIHVRYCSPNANAPEKYKFNINPNTLSADYELWVCGNAETYYLMPTFLMQSIYDNLDTYVDRQHPDIRVVSVDSRLHTITYATGGVKSNIKDYFCATLP